MMRYMLLLILINFTYSVFCQSNIRVGEKAPQIHITDWIRNKPKDTVLRDKFLVLEFWASWCSPCLKAVPHLNDLQDSFNRKDLYFISITDESPQVVKSILKRIPFNSIVVSDQTEQTHIEFGDGKKGLDAIPMTVLIDDRNIIQWVGRPHLLTSDVMDEFLARTLKGQNTLIKKADPENTEVDHSISEKTQKRTHQKMFYQIVEDQNIFYHYNLEKSFADSVFRSTSQIGGAFQFENYPVLEMISHLTDWTDEQVIVPDSIRNMHFNLTYKNTGSEYGASVIATMLKALELQQDTILETTKVFEVSTGDLSKLDTTAQEFSTFSNSLETLIMKNTTIKSMIKKLNDFSPKLIELEEAAEGSYDFVIKINSLSEILNSLRLYGFSIQEVEKKVAMLKLSYQDK